MTPRLRALGFRWSKVLRHWEGLADFDAARRAADELGGTLRRVTAGAGPAPAGRPAEAGT